jgi:heavy metal translocating P-type ATPase
MNCRILDECRGSMRVRLSCTRMDFREADALEYCIGNIDGVRKAVVYERTGDAVIIYSCNRQQIIKTLSGYHGMTPQMSARIPEKGNREINSEYADKLAGIVIRKVIRDFCLPAPVRFAWNFIRSMRYFLRGIKSLRSGKLKVELLDAISIGVSMLRGDFDTAGNVMFLLALGELLEEWTRKKSINDLAHSMALNIDKVWLKTDETEILVPVSQIKCGDRIAVHTGNVIPLDGQIIRGEVYVNQSAMTGESLPVRKAEGSSVYAGTVLEEGECIISVEKENGSGRYDRIVSMIEDSEKMKSATESHALLLADRLVPYSLGITALTYIFTRNVNKAVSVLMVDFSCALKLSMPLAVLSAMRECGDAHAVVKGGKYLEALASADTIVFDKTGTLTHADPRVALVVPFAGNNEKYVLQVAACLEEHYPHSMANAVVREAKIRNIDHDEMHSEVKYVVAHGIASRINGKTAVIGSAHFVFEDEKCNVPEYEQEKFSRISDEYSHLYLAIDKILVGVICISDPLREETAAVITELKKLGIRKTVMMTGDSERTAFVIAERAGVDIYYSEVLPEDKAEFIRKEREAGHTVIMTGDGINDSPALSEADVGIAISDGAAIARQIADITIKADSLEELVFIRKIADALQKRINSNYKFVINFNSLLIILGIAGVITPSASALLHNLSTLAISMRSMTDLLTSQQ